MSSEVKKVFVKKKPKNLKKNECMAKSICTVECSCHMHVSYL